MPRLTIILEGWLALYWMTQCVLCWAYAKAIRTQSTGDVRTSCPAAQLPRICVIMPLRGADPYLSDAINSVLDNDYPNLQLRIIVDHPGDAAEIVVQEVLRRRGAANASVSSLHDKPPQRSLVCSSVIQAFDAAAESCDLIAFCAADTVVPRNWYWIMASEMMDPSVGCTLGNRWYLPLEGRWGSLVRQAWNAGAAVLMWLFRIPWGGAAVLRPADVLRSGLRDAWEHSLVEDVPIYDAMRRAGLKMKFVPELTNVNREEIGLWDCVRFVKRQMIWARLYHPNFVLVVGHALLGLATMLVPLAVAAVLSVRGEVVAAAWLVASLGVYLVGLAGLLALVESSFHGILQQRDEKFHAWSVVRWCQMIVAIALTQLIYPLALLGCCFARSIDWRGIHYRILGRGQVQMVEYVPFCPAPASDGKTSI